MNLPIKFRAWDKELTRMYGAGFSLNCWGEVSILWHADKQRKNYAEDIVLMQFTGLLDKNEKEIYEGDIVQVFFAGSGQTAEDKCYTVTIQDIRDAFHGVGEGMGEVIGNIYENPELL